MDQSASVAGDVILFDSATLSFEHLLPDLGDFVFAVADSGVGRALSSSSYPVRVQESKQAVERISALLGLEILSLGSLSVAELEEVAGQLDPVLFKRARHVVTEVARVQKGVEALAANDWPAFGALMIASGRSSALNYEISHPNVEELVREALAVEGVAGARMMGGGEGGTALILLERSAFPNLVAHLGAGYYARKGLGDPAKRVLVQSFGPGARSGEWSDRGNERPL
jgi:galactokinase